MSTKMTRNPLNVIFGAYLKKERNALRQSSSSIAKKMQLGDSNYRMIEAGSAYLNINRLSLLVQTFYESKIKFERLTKFVAAIHILEFELSANNPLKQALQIIEERDEDLEHYVKRTKNIYSFQYASKEYERFIADVAIKELYNFLSDDDYRTKESEQFKVESLDILLGIPSIEVTNILKFLSSLNNRTPLHVGPIASEWERDTPGFRSLRAIYRDTGLIINEDNFKDFTYEYLFDPQFQIMRLIFIVTDFSVGDLKKEYIRFLQSARRKIGKHLLGEVELQKISIKTILQSDINEVQMEQFFKERADIFPKLDAYWNFTNAQGVEIGFVGGADRAKGYAINLSYRESLTRSKLFDKIWD